MTNIKSLQETLIEKLYEWSDTKHMAEIVVDVFLATLETEGYSDDDIINVLEGVSKIFKQSTKCGSVTDLLSYDIIQYRLTTIGVNGGY